MDANGSSLMVVGCYWLLMIGLDVMIGIMQVEKTASLWEYNWYIMEMQPRHELMVIDRFMITNVDLMRING
jgi:hypothetical protein